MLTEKKGADFDRGDLIREINARVGALLADMTAAEIIETVIHCSNTVVADALTKHGRVEIIDLGTFRLKLRKAKSGTGFDGADFQVPSHMKVSFKASPYVRQRIGEDGGFSVF